MWCLSARSFLFIALLFLKKCETQDLDGKNPQHGKGQRPPDRGKEDPKDQPPPRIKGTSESGQGGEANAQKHRFTTPSTTKKRFLRTTPFRVSFEENCDYLAHYCLKAYTTGKLCGRTLYYGYYTFRNYCLLDYINCMERYEVYPYNDDYFLDQYYILEDHR